MTDAAHLVAAHGGSLSGEHGDGRARGELLPLMYSAPAVRRSRVQGVLDPADLLNPGVIVGPGRSTPTCAGRAPPRCPGAGGFAFGDDGGDLTNAVHRCVGVGKCRADSRGRRLHVPVLPGHPGREGLHPGPGPGAAGVAGGHARHRRLARARGARGPRPVPVLQGLRDRLPGRGGHGAVQVRGAATGLPAAAAAPRALRARLAAALVAAGRPSRRGWSTPCWGTPGGGGGAHRGRHGPPPRIPRFAAVPFRRWRPARGPPATAPGGAAWPAPGRRWCCGPTRSATISTRRGPGGAAVLRRAGYHVTVPAGTACCGLTWISTGQLDGARGGCARCWPSSGRTPRRAPDRRPGAVLYRGAPLGPGRPVPRRSAGGRGGRATGTLAELLTAPPPARDRLALPDLAGRRSSPSRTATSTRCMGFDADRALLAGRRDRADAGRVLRAGRQLRHGTRPLRGLGRRGRDGAAARAARRPARRGVPGRRLQLPHPGRPAGRCAGSTSPSCWPESAGDQDPDREGLEG